MNYPVNLRSLVKSIPILLFINYLVSCQPNHSFPYSIIEITDYQSVISKEEIIRYAEEYQIDKNSLYNWGNRWVLYVDENRLDEIKAGLENRFTQQEIKVFTKPFYCFNREKNCNKKSAAQWTNMIMTANLVVDSKLQDEYMEYHRVQFEEWPEVANGFCNARFQQVLVFRNGRQLMLVISIPVGESLDELNPKTTENNPRVDEWNNIMKRYQEGIDGAPEGVVWIGLKQVKTAKDEIM